MSYLLAQIGSFSTLIQNLQSMGFFQYLFPFLLALAIVYGILKYVLPNEFPKSATGLISLIIAFFVMLYAASAFNLSIVLSGMFGSGILMLGSVILIIIILLGLVGIKPESLWSKGEKVSSITGKGWAIVLLIAVIAILVIFGVGIETIVGVPGWATNSDLWTIIFFLIILAIVFYFLSREKESE